MTLVAGLFLLSACAKEPQNNTSGTQSLSLSDVAQILSRTGLGTEQMGEVFDAVNCSSDNGYDQEYLLSDMLLVPGTGVGGTSVKSSSSYSCPLKSLVHNAAGEENASLIDGLAHTDMQIYWPYADSWDGESLPIVTYDPGDGSEANLGWRLKEDGTTEEVFVDEQTAKTSPVWVINRNDDASYTTLEMLRKNDPDWGQGGSIIIGRHPSSDTKASHGKTLLLKDFTMLEQGDSWFAGASEYFVKMGSVEDFYASTEAELKLYSPSITDFMISVKRSELGQKKPFNAILVSDWTEQLDKCAFLVTEDDGGTKTSWKCTAVVKVESKSYGIEINLPMNTSDDIIWRGQLSRKYLEGNSGTTAHFGTVDLTFELVDF